MKAPDEHISLSVPSTFELTEGTISVTPKKWDEETKGFELIVQGLPDMPAQGLQVWQRGDEKGIAFISAVRSGPCTLDEAKSLLEGLNFKDPAVKEELLASLNLDFYGKQS